MEVDCNKVLLVFVMVKRFKKLNHVSIRNCSGNRQQISVYLGTEISKSGRREQALLRIRKRSEE